MQLAEFKLQGQPGLDAGLGTGSWGKSVCVGEGCWGRAGSHMSLALCSLPDLGEPRTVLVCGNMKDRLEQESAAIWKGPVHTQPHLQGALWWRML